MGNCNQCRHFRKAKQQSQILGTTFSTSQAEVIQALNKIQEDEQKIRDSEIDFKRNQASANKEYWPCRPVMSDYCALEEETNQLYFICEVKNPPPGECKDFDSTIPPLHSCKDCIHRIPANGTKRDLEREEQSVNMAAAAIIADADPGVANSLLESQRKSSPERKSFELTAAYHSRGRMAVRPTYLDYCRKLSTDDEYVVCVMNNPWHRCGEWQSWNSESSGIDLPKNTTPYSEITTLLPVLDSADTSILFETSPPITQGSIKQLIAFHEFFLGFKIPSDTRAYLTELILSNLQEGKDSPDVLNQAALHLAQHADIISLLESSVNPSVIFQFNLMEHISELRQAANSSELCRTLINLYDFYNQPLVPSKSILSQSMIDYWIEWPLFLNANLINQEKGWPKISLASSHRSALIQSAIELPYNHTQDAIKMFVNNSLVCRYLKYHFKWNTFRTDQWLEWRKSMIEQGFDEIARTGMQMQANILEQYKNNSLNRYPTQEPQSENVTEADQLIEQQKQLQDQLITAAMMRQEHAVRMQVMNDNNQVKMAMIRNL